MVKIVLVIAPSGFRDEELFETKSVLEEKGIKVIVASRGVKEAVGKLGGKTSVDIEIDSVNSDEYDGIAFIGGLGVKSFLDDINLHEIARDFFNKGKIVGAICMASSILANADLLVGRRATAFSSEKKNLEDKGAEYTGESVTVDGSIVTSNGPDAAEEFGEKLAESLM